MTTFVFDATALMRYMDREPGHELVAERLKQAARGEAAIMMSAVNWGEVIAMLYKAHGRATASVAAMKLRALPFTIVPVDEAAAESAGLFQQDFGVPYVDGFAGSLALRLKAVLVTDDTDFKAAAQKIKIEFL